jgi:hypothetical protein
MVPKIVHGPAEHNIRGRVNIPRFAQEATPFAQNIEVGSAMRRVAAGHVRLMSIFQEHQAYDKGDDAASHHDKFHHDVSGIAEPNAVVF